MPARQIAPVLVALVQGGEGAPDRLTVLLEPEELGRIEIAVDRDSDRRVSIAVLAERAETLHLLQRDASLLDRALAQAGVGAEGRSLAFDLGGSSRNTRQEERGTRREARAGGEPQAVPTPAPASPLSLLDIAI
ncbi:MAG: flagellar hook-length control protein FliK [Acetobacteraceae bacterium]